MIQVVKDTRPQLFLELFKGIGYTFRGDNFIKIVFIPFWEASTLCGKNLGVYSIREDFAHSGSKFFPYKRDLFSEGS